MKELFSCPMIAGQDLVFEGRVDERCIMPCCEKHIPNVPAVGFADTAEETLDRFLGMRAMVAATFLNTAQSDRYGCGKCFYFRKAAWEFAHDISFVNLSMYPAPCQCKCIYCCESEHVNAIYTPEVKAGYEKLFALLEYAKTSGVINPDATWQISSGEITIHPYKERIMELVRDRHAVFFTNAFLFDEAIAQRLHDDPESKINLSIDSGTPETWRRVKGFDNFETVLSNLRRYRKSSVRPGQIILKYIILPGVNDSEEDFRSVVEIAKELEVGHLTVARDTERKYKHDDEYRGKLLDAAARLLAVCKANGITNDMFTYSTAEQAEVRELAEKLLTRTEELNAAPSAGQAVKRPASPKVSVVIPVYNVEKYLRQTLDSVLSQTLRDIEIICVDDGSTDSSLEILLAYAARDTRIQAYTQANAGVSAARNRAMAHAKGEYIAFLDADDYYLPDALQKAYSKAKEDDADICIYGTINLHALSGETVEIISLPDPNKLPEIIPYNIKTCPEHILNIGRYAVIDKIYRRSFLEENSIHFPLLKLGEDQYVNTLAICFAERITVLPEPVYFYRVLREGSATSTLHDKAMDNIDNLLVCANVLKERGIYPERSFVNMALDSICWMFQSMRCTWPAYEALFNRLKSGDAQKLGLTIREPGYYYIPWQEETLTHFWQEDAKDFSMFLLSITERRRAETDVIRNDQIAKLYDQIAKLNHSVSFRVGRAITWLPRKIRGGVRCYQEHGPAYTVRRTIEHLTGKAQKSRAPDTLCPT